MMAALTDHPSVSRCLQQVRFNPESEWMLFDHDRIIWQFPPVTRSKFVRHTVHYRRCAALALGLYAGRHRPADRSPDPSAENAGHERQKRRALHSRGDRRDADPARFQLNQLCPGQEAAAGACRPRQLRGRSGAPGLCDQGLLLGRAQDGPLPGIAASSPWRPAPGRRLPHSRPAILQRLKAAGPASEKSKRILGLLCTIRRGA